MIVLAVIMLIFTVMSILITLFSPSNHKNFDSTTRGLSVLYCLGVVLLCVSQIWG